eukprot:11181533-Lingulodinium_polyedra.AAC.1
MCAPIRKQNRRPHVLGVPGHDPALPNNLPKRTDAAPDAPPQCPREGQPTRHGDGGPAAMTPSAAWAL